MEGRKEGRKEYPTHRLSTIREVASRPNLKYRDQIPPKTHRFACSGSLCQELVGPGGIIANIGVHGQKVDLHLERLWSHNVAITTRLVDTATTPMLLRTVQSGKIDPTRLITHHFKLAQILDAYDTFSRAAETHALKVIITA
ncbi:MAG: hypothetical protein PHI71_14725 [Acidiphilium sp.]|nr:hypothetical protein [Acidiphilium sp.]